MDTDEFRAGAQNEMAVDDSHAVKSAARSQFVLRNNLLPTASLEHSRLASLVEKVQEVSGGDR
jgi:hypothetical protein